MKIRSLKYQFERWRASRVELLGQIDSLRQENERLREKLTLLQQAKDQAEKHAEDRRREKEALRARVQSQKQELAVKGRLLGELGAKVTELRAEIDAMASRKNK